MITIDADLNSVHYNYCLNSPIASKQVLRTEACIAETQTVVPKNNVNFHCRIATGERFDGHQRLCGGMRPNLHPHSWIHHGALADDQMCVLEACSWWCHNQGRGRDGESYREWVPWGAWRGESVCDVTHWFREEGAWGGEWKEFTYLTQCGVGKLRTGTFEPVIQYEA